MTDDTQPPTILIVEDEPSLADLFADFLASTYTVRTAYGGAEALDMIDDEVDVVLLDRRMPGLAGEEVLEAIRDAGYDCRVAMVTAVTPEEDIIDMGFDDYLEKPIERKDMLETVEHLVELNAYDELVQEYYQLLSKKAALTVEEANIDLSESDGFNRLTERLEEVEADLERSEDARSESDIRSLLRWSRSGSDDG